MTVFPSQSPDPQRPAPLPTNPVQRLVVVLCALLVTCTLTSCITRTIDRGTLKGVATSQYADFDGRRTASGELYDDQDLTCGHRSLPFGTVIKVTSMTTQRSVVVRVNDRGPFQKNRILNLSTKAAKMLGADKATPVTIEILTQT